MIGLLLVLVVAGDPPAAADLEPARASAADEWAASVCPESGAEAASNVEQKEQAAAQVKCLERAMNRAIDQSLVPLKKTNPKAFRAGMALQAKFNRWKTDSCRLEEDTFWMDTESGTRTDGSARGTMMTECRRRLTAARGLEAAATADAARWAGPWRAALDLAAHDEPASAAALKEYAGEVARAHKQAALRGAPTGAAPVGADPAPISERDWLAVELRLDGALGTANELARGSCEAKGPSGGAACERELATFYRGLLHLRATP